jgi:hypothetical protein
MLEKYSAIVERQMQDFYSNLKEREQRHYAAVEALKLPHGGKKYIQGLFDIHHKTLKRAINELTHPELFAPLPTDKQRRSGGGRKKKTDHYPNSQAQLHALIDKYKAGSPTNPNVYWIHLKPKEIATLYFDKYGVLFSNGFIKRELLALGYKYRKIRKTLATGTYKNRDTQFQIIFNLVLIMSLKSPVLSIDCKKKELLGTLYRDGKSYGQAAQEAYDHDYSHLGEGKVIPHGIFDLQKNLGFITIGSSSETASFIVDNLRWWWFNYGINDYPEARNLLLLCDAGGGNSYRHHAFKKELQAFAKEIGIDIIVAHYPPYASKWNPIEHRLFCHVHQAMSGQMFKDYEFVKTLIEKTSTSQGLKVIVRIHLKEYQTGIKTHKSEVDEKRIQRHPTIPELSYRIAA